MSGAERQRRLTWRELDVLHALIMRGAALLPTTLRSDQRPIIVPMWRRQLIELWFRRPPETQAPMQGPFYRLTPAGAQLARSPSTNDARPSKTRRLAGSLGQEYHDG